jgi:hypothetical protein
MVPPLLTRLPDFFSSGSSTSLLRLAHHLTHHCRSPLVNMAPKPVLDFVHFAYTATVLVRVCPGYSDPYGQGGIRTEHRYARGVCVPILQSIDSRCGNYVSALTHEGCWINMWCLHNLRRQPVGVRFCDVHAVPLPPPNPPTTSSRPRSRSPRANTHSSLYD